MLIFEVQAELRVIEQNRGYQRNAGLPHQSNFNSNGSLQPYVIASQSISIGPTVYGAQSNTNMDRPENSFNFENWRKNNDCLNISSLRPAPQTNTSKIEVNQGSFKKVN